MQKRKAATSPAVVRRLDIAEDAMKLRASGASFREIASKLGSSPASVHRAVSDAIAEQRANLMETVEQVRELEAMRLDRLTRFHTRILDDEVRPVIERQRSADCLLRVSAQRCKMYGLDAPQKVELSIPAQLDNALSALALAVGNAVAELDLGDAIAARLLEAVTARVGEMAGEAEPSARLLEMAATD